MKPTNWNLPRLISYNCLITEDRDSSPDQWTPAKNLSPSASQWTRCLDSGWTPCALHSLPMDTTHPKPSVTYLWVVQHAFGELQFLRYSWKKKKKLNFCSFELASVNFFIWVHRYRSKGIESRDSMEICTTVFVVTLFTVAKRRNQPKQGPIERWMGKQNVAIYTM